MIESRMTAALDKRFDDLEEIKDVANHGCEGGVSDFITTTKLVNSLTSTKRK